MVAGYCEILTATNNYFGISFGFLLYTHKIKHIEV